MRAKQYDIPHHTDDWYAFRTTGISEQMAKRLKVDPFIGGTGASEIGIVLGIVDYSPTKMGLFHYKVGSMEREIFDNENMFHGRNNEAYIGRLWQCWDGTEAGYIEVYKNYLEEVKKIGAEEFLVDDIDDITMIIASRTNANNTLVRKANRLNPYLVHPDYKYLFASLDFISGGDSFPMIDVLTPSGLISRGELIAPFPIECKNINQFAASKWDYGVPDAYIAQLNVQMLLTDSYYGELAVMRGGNHFEVHYVERNDALCRQILKLNTEFWEENILPAREFYNSYKEAVSLGLPSEADMCMASIQRLEPIPNANPAYKSELSDMHNVRMQEITGDDDMMNVMYERMLAHKSNDMSGRKKQELDNIITKMFVDNETEIINFGANGRVKYYLRGNNKNKQLDFSGFKIKVTEDEASAYANEHVFYME